MRVKELIAILQNCDPDARVTVQDGTPDDGESTRVEVGIDPNGCVHIGPQEVYPQAPRGPL